MDISVDTSGTDVVIAVRGEIDAHNCSELGKAILAAASGGEPSIVIDAAELGFIDSSAISELLRVRQAIAERGGTLTIANAGTSVKRVLEITGLLDTFGVS